MDETTCRIDYEVHGLKLGVPTRASVVIVRKYGGFLEDGTILLSHELKTEEEIEFCINDLKKNLDDVGRSAKRDLRQANEQIRRKISENRRRP